MYKPVVTNLTAAATVLLLMAVGGSFRAEAQKNVVQPGDAAIASSSNSPGSEGVANAIDGTQTKYLNFDLDSDAPAGAKPAGFVVTPSVGATRVTALGLQSANDAQDRDPKVVTLEGSNDAAVTSFSEGNWELIATLDNIPSWPSVFGETDAEHRYMTQILEFNNLKAYRHYRFTVTETQGPSTCCMQIAEVQFLGTVLPGDVTQPGDPLVASSSNSPGSEGVANAIDGTETKYLNFDLDSDLPEGPKPVGFIVTPSLGKTVVTGMTLQSANDAQDRDPKWVTLEGSNDASVTDFASGNWEVITTITNIPSWPSVFGETDAEHRFKTQTFLFDNVRPYTHYRWTVVETQGPSTCCMQIAEVELLGTGAPQDVTQPGDTIIASSSNSPGSEGVANAIDGTETKYLNFDLDSDLPEGPKPVGFVVTPSIGETTVIGMTLQSANDAQDRDPKWVTLEGSNDETITDFASGNWEVITTITNIPSWPSVFGETDAEHRFQTQEFYFENNTAYKHYRWTVIETQGPSTCCMQIAEVELLAATSGADCAKAAFVLQPVDVPVLEGSQATFVSQVNGPWPVQWYRNGEPIPGAAQVTYTTEAITTANATNIYSVEIVGCEMSSEVQAVIFTPSPTKSIGINFVGWGANGAPTAMLTNDIAGIHPQAYWVNTPNADLASGSLPSFDDPPIEVVDSDNQPSTITVEWTSTGAWGSGTGEGTPTQRLLNGLVHDQAGGEPANVTFYNVPAGSHAVIAYFVGIPLQFQDSDYTVIGQSTQTVNVRVMNSDEYNAAPGFYRGVSTNPNDRSLATYVRFDNVTPDASGTVILQWSCLTSGFDRGTPVNAVQLVLNATPPGAPPLITGQPQPTVTAEGGTARISVSATGEDLTYQWLKNGRSLPNGGNIDGATTPILTISDFSPADEGVYNVAIFNEGGSTISGTASVRISQFDIEDALSGYWTFDASSGSTVPNAVAGGEAGTVTGPATWGAGQVGNALTFDGASTFAVVDDYPKAAKGLAASTWVRLSSEVFSDAAIARNAEGVFGLVPAGQFELGLDYNDETQMAYPFASIRVGPNIITAASTTAFPVGTWQHLAFSADGAQLRLYVNGVQVAVTDYVGNINPPDVDYLTFGARLAPDVDSGVVGPDLAAPNMLPGQIDDFALWSRALTADEVSKVYAAGQAGDEVTTVVVTPPAQGDGTYKIGLNFGTDQPDSTLAATDVAGVEDVAQANWNNLPGQTGSTNSIIAQVDGTTTETTTTSVVWASNNTWASTGIGEENNQFTGADETLMTGYLDTDAATTTSVTISNLPPTLTAEGYDVYVYLLGGTPGRGGGYRILDGSGAVLEPYTRAQYSANPTNYVQVPTDDPASTNNIGNYLLFTGLTASTITVEATTANDMGFGSTFRAPLNAIQIVAPSSGPGGGPIVSIARDAEGNAVITYEGTLQSADDVTGPYTDVAGATSPHTVTPTDDMKFYRSVVE